MLDMLASTRAWIVERIIRLRGAIVAEVLVVWW